MSGTELADDEFRRDQQQLDRAHTCLEQMKERTESVQEVAARAVRDENTADARVVEAKLSQRRALLDVGSGPLCFGRIDEEPTRPSDSGQQWYVGRRHVEDAKGDPVVVDWRAPVSAAFYRATAVDPCGLERRRRFSSEGPQLEAVFDEDLTDPEAGGAGGLPDPLLAELDRSRTGTMRDIVSTIATEQDLIIRAPLEELLVVQGGPGTGKTAVGLHRAAFLLFQHRDYFFESKVLVVGPNPVFLRYVSEVLPSLGETSVIQTTLVGLLSARYPVRKDELVELVALKGDARMAQVIRNLMTGRIRPLPDGLELRSGLSVVRFSAAEVAAFQARALERSVPFNAGREVFRTILLREAWLAYQSRPGVDPGNQPAFVAAIRSDPAFKKDFDRMWPLFSPPVVIRELLGSRSRRAGAAQGLLTEGEQALLHQKNAKKAGDQQWSAADLPLIDEATSLAGGVKATYGHVVVDEAQDHTAMALRMLGRRSVRHSMTVLGDLAQATAPGAMTTWAEAGRHLAGEQQASLTELTVGYRVPAAILDVANRLLPEAAPSVTPAVSVRPGGVPPEWVWPDGLGADADLMVAAVATALGMFARSARSTAVIAMKQHQALLFDGLGEAGFELTLVGNSGGLLPGAKAVALLGPAEAKGLEFDAVVVVDPEGIASEANGLRLLYVAMTRAVQQLILVGKPGPATATL